ncbi:hypothetical protein PpBr36_07189 [Pyricularia pennisetigena]|uniref:hypothetical protein n=1 Tax=Pyricularia pennisetigena TaxID=1578925 RepID=UPI001151658D|nr:hypothetical protein PpBr36_07189 [Pyricularia pennisetigena]TLS25924.1 hypothetical protein PpBr36_07189 [Pyricularia pennisetigena]
MEGSAIAQDEFEPPVRIIDRLKQISGYTWDEDSPIYHTSYDTWHVSGSRFVPAHVAFQSPTHHTPVSASSPPITSSSLSSATSPTSLTKSSPVRPPGLSDTHSSNGLFSVHCESCSECSAASTSPSSQTHATEAPLIEEPVVARVSFHVLREERAFHIAKNLVAGSDRHCEHIAKPLELIRLARLPGDRGSVAVTIYSDAGENYLPKVLDLGPAFFKARKTEEGLEIIKKSDFRLEDPISLPNFLDFAIGATECLELLHHGQGIIHGEIRGDAFHFNLDSKKVKLASLGSGVRSFERGLTSTGWSALSKETGAKNKLLFISPEQTGRMPVEPDTRTDIYSLGILFWMLLTQQPVFVGATPLDVVQMVLNRRVVNVSSERMDIPEAIGRIVAKCTEKDIHDRYSSASGLRYDLEKVKQFLIDGNWLALKEWQVAERDVSSFFLLPPIMVGREEEKRRLGKIIERAAKGHTLNLRANPNRFSDGSNMSNEFPDGATINAEISSDGASSADGNTTRHSGSFTNTLSTDLRFRNFYQPNQSYDGNPLFSPDTLPSANPSFYSARASTRPWDRHQSVSFDTRSLADTVVSAERDLSYRHSSAIDSVSLGRQLGSAKLRRRGHCEIVLIEGAGGLGKSCLLEAVWPEMRRKGYAAKAKFDTARKDPFGPLLKLLSSLFRQVWGGESDTTTPLHQALKQQVFPTWKSLHKLLDLPEFLLGTVEPVILRTIPIVNGAPAPAHGKLVPRAVPKRRGSSPGSSSSSAKNVRPSTQSSHDFLRAGTSTKSIRLMNSYLDILRTFTHYKFICFCLEDLHFADDESMDLISQVIAARLNMLILITYRPEEMTAAKMQKILTPPDLEDPIKSTGLTITRIPLSPLVEDDIAKYVAATVRRPPEEISPLVLVIQSKTAGNPFYMREMLSACHRKKCVWHDYRENKWKFDLDRLFKEFEGEQNYDVLNTDFITRRLDELPAASRAILSWAALLGTSFSFEFICHLLSGEFDDDGKDWHSGHKPTGYSQDEAVAGLEAAVQAYIVVQGDRDDRFRFAHDRYIQAAAKINSCDTRKMHFIVAQTLMKYCARDNHTKENTASHICEALGIIRAQVKHRMAYRSLLYECAEVSTARGARPTAAKYFSGAVALLQTDPWNETNEDVSYDETMRLYLAAAECYLFMGQLQLASGVLDTIFDCATSAFDKAPAWVLRSRVYAQSGNSTKALACLKDCLRTMGVDCREDRTVEQCDEEFERLSAKIQSMEFNDVLQPRVTHDEARADSIGAVLAEAISAAWWSDWLCFYQLSLYMLEMHLTTGAIPQSPMAFVQVSMIALARFNRLVLAKDLGEYAFALLNSTHDSFSMARGYMIQASFVGHVIQSVGLTAEQLESSLNYAASAGDRISAILGFGLYAQVRFFASEHCVDLESICNYSCEEIPNWQLDSRGGTMLIAVRQVSRALQGKTRVSEALDVMSDDQHQAPAYKIWLEQAMENTNRALIFYESLEMAPLFLYGHYERAAEVGKFCVENSALIWSARNTRFAMLFYGLAIAGLVLRQRQDPRTGQRTAPDSATVQDTIRELERLHKQIVDWQVLDKVSYYCWSKLLEAQIAELTNAQGVALQRYEEALDHAAEHDFVFEEALGNYLMAGTFIRLSARRSAWAALRDALSSYRQMGAAGVAEYIESEHSLLMRGPTVNPRLVNAGTQTEGDAEAQSKHYNVLGDDSAAQQLTDRGVAMTDASNDKVGAWRKSMTTVELDSGLPSLDVVDLHAILQSSQIISSVLNVDELLKTMCDVILSTCGTSATLAAMVVQEQGADVPRADAAPEWCVAASGNPEKGAEAHSPRIPLTNASVVAENVVLYTTRFREAVFVPNILTDDRFSNVSATWLQRNPAGKAVIAMPICHGDKPLLGVLYIEGTPNSLSHRYRDVLQLLVNQVGISYSNALTMKAVEKVSAENVSMVQMQKQALEHAIEAEKKAKDAEAKARQNVKLAEEAAKAKSIFLANVSHELRTPLNGVIGNSELLRDSLSNKEQLEMADSIRVSADLLLTVINDILDFSRMEADKMKLYIIAFNPEEMVREVVRAVSYSNQEKTRRNNVQIIKEINLPQLLIYGDPIRLHQVLGNLIGNSLKFTDRGSITIGARVDSETEDSATLSFWVKDTGIGIPPAQLAKLFQPFSQADPSTARKYGGSGLGLSICKSLVETMMKGKITLDSADGVGTTAMFTVKFDKARPEIKAGEAQQIKQMVTSPETAQMRSELQHHHRHQHYHQYYHQENLEAARAIPSVVDLSQIPREMIRICIAEDNAINSRIAIQYAHRLGYTTVDAYENGQLAVEALRKKAAEGVPYHICLMDVQMPVLDGYSASKLIREDPVEDVRSILIIAMTASAVAGDRERCLAAGMNDYLAKPVRCDVLRKKLDAYVVGVNPTEHASEQTSSSSTSPSAASFPRYETNGAASDPPSRESTSARVSPRPSSVENFASPVSGFLSPGSDSQRLAEGSIAPESNASSARRQPRKLTKNRGSAETSKIDTNVMVVEKTPKVLQKKNAPHRAGSTDAQHYDSQPSMGSGRLDGNSRSHSIASLSSGGSREKIGTYPADH